MIAGLAYYYLWWLPHGVPVQLDIRTKVVNIRSDAEHPPRVNEDFSLQNIELGGPFKWISITPGGNLRKQPICVKFFGNKNARFEIAGRVQMTGLTTAHTATMPFQISLADDDSIDFDALPYGSTSEEPGLRQQGIFSGRFQMAQPGTASFRTCNCFRDRPDRNWSIPDQSGYSLGGGALVAFESAKRIRLRAQNSASLFKPFLVKKVSFFELVDGVPQSAMLENSSMTLDWPDEKKRDIQLLLDVQPAVDTSLSVNALYVDKGVLHVMASGRVRSLIAGQLNDSRDILPGFIAWMNHSGGWAWFLGVLLPVIKEIWSRVDPAKDVDKPNPA